MGPVDQAAEKGAQPPLRREAGAVLSGRVPVVLAVMVALLAGAMLGFGWRGLMCDRECSRASATMVRRPAVVELPCQSAADNPVARMVFIAWQGAPACSCGDPVPTVEPAGRVPTVEPAGAAAVAPVH